MTTPRSWARSPNAWSCSADRSRSAMASGVALEHTRTVGASRPSITSSLYWKYRRTAPNPWGATPSTSLTGWKRSMLRPRSAQRCPTSEGRRGEQIRSLSNISMPSNLAAEIACSLSSSRPLIETVAIPLCMRLTFLAGRVTPRVTNDVKWRSIQSASGARPEKDSKGIDRLEDSHAATVRHGTTAAPGDREQFDLQWKYTTSANHN